MASQAALTSDKKDPIRGRIVVGFLLFFGILTAHTILETLRDTLFLTKLEAAQLPWVYLAIAGLAFFVARANQRAMERWNSRRLLAATLVFAAVVTAIFGPCLAVSGTWALYALYVWTGLVATLAVAQLWILLGDSFDVAQAKRAFGVIGAGGLVGATTGAALAGALLAVLQPEHLLYVASLLFLATAALSLKFPKGDEKKAEGRPHQQAAIRDATRAGGSYMWRLLLLLGVTTITVTTGDLLFKSVVKAEVPADQLGTFFALFYAGLNGVSLLVQLFLASWLLRILGVSRALWVLPALLVGGAAAVFFTPLAALALKVFDGTLRHSLNKTGTELLYLPLPRRMRARYKVVVDAVGARGGQAVAALGVLAALTLGAELHHLAIGLLIMCGVWLWSVASIRGHYVQLFRESLKAGTIETRVDVRELDLHSLETLIAALSHPDDVVVINALDLLEQSGRANLVPALILYHPAQRVVLRGLSIFTRANRTDFTPLAERLLASVDPQVRAAALQALSQVAPDGDTLRNALEDSSAVVRATAMVALVAHEMCTLEEAEAFEARALASDDPDERQALAQAIRVVPDARFFPVLHKFLELEERELQAEVARVVQARPDPQFLPALVQLLAHRTTRPAARAAMLSIGRPAIEYLDSALEDCQLPRRVRLHLPRTVSRFAEPLAAAVLIKHLGREMDSVVGYKILRGLGRLAADNPAITIDRTEVGRIADDMLKRAINVLSWRETLSKNVDHETARLLLILLRQKEQDCVERVFRLLGLLYPNEDMAVMYTGFFNGDAKTRANSRELLEYVAVGPRGDALIQMLDEGQSSRRLERVASFYTPPTLDLKQLLQVMLRDPIDAISGLTAHYIGEVGLTELGDELEDVHQERATSRMADVLEEALGHLRGRSLSHAT